MRDLRKELPRQRLILIWDGLPAHRSRAMLDHLYAQRRWLQVERLPAYVSEFNPAESLWSNVKSLELANFCDPSLGGCRLGIRRVHRHRTLLFSFLQHAGLSL